MTRIQLSFGAVALLVLAGCSTPGGDASHPIPVADKYQLQADRLDGLMAAEQQSGKLSDSDRSRAAELLNDIGAQIKAFGGIEAMPAPQQHAVLKKQTELIALYSPKRAKKTCYEKKTTGRRVSKC